LAGRDGTGLAGIWCGYLNFRELIPERGSGLTNPRQLVLDAISDLMAEGSSSQSSMRVAKATALDEDAVIAVMDDLVSERLAKPGDRLESADELHVSVRGLTDHGLRVAGR
jgi:hypothetical protein